MNAFLARFAFRCIALMVLFLLVGLPANAQRQSVETEAAYGDVRLIEQYLRTQMQLNHIPSISVAVVRDGTIVLLAAYGTANVEWTTPATVKTAYQLASATKPITATALMLLSQEGILSLDDSVTHYLSDAPEEWNAITIRHLVNHSSGITDDLGPEQAQTAEEAFRRAAAAPLVFEPGSRSAYGIGGYAVLQHLIEVVTGEAYADFLQRRLLAPLEMKNTRFDHSSNDGPFRVADAVAYRAGIYTWEDEAQRIFWFHFGRHAYTAGGLHSTSEDLARWAAALDSGRFLSPEVANEMMHGGKTGFGIGWALGTYRGRRTVGHSGGPALADILRFPDEKLTIIVLANQSKMYPYLAQGVADLLLDAPSMAAAETAIDTDPALTATLRDFLHALARGDVPEELFTTEARSGIVPQLRTFFMPYARSLGAPTELRFVEETAEEESLVRTYRALYGDKPLAWVFKLVDGKIASLQPTAE